MNIIMREICDDDLSSAIEIWNRVVEDGVAFPSWSC